MNKWIAILLLFLPGIAFGQIEVTKLLKANGTSVNTGNFLFLDDTCYISSKKALYINGDTLYLGSAPIGVVAVNGGLLLDNTTVTADGLVRYTGTDVEVYIAGTGWVSMTGNNTYKEELVTNKTVFSVGFILQTSSIISFNGIELRNNQWSGEGTSSLTVALDTEQYDYIIIEQ